MSENKLQQGSGPGATLRAIRVERGLTLTEVADLTGLPVSTLSKMENGKMSLSYDKLTRISDGLKLDIGRFFIDAQSGGNAPIPFPTGRRSVQRAGEGGVIDTESYLHVFPAGDLLNKQFVPVVTTLRTRTLDEFGPLIRHSGEEYAYVLEGSVVLHTDLYAPLTLDVGDSIYFDSSMGHAYLAGSAGACRMLVICSCAAGVATMHETHMCARAERVRAGSTSG